jgi:hypothetical protein
MWNRLGELEDTKCMIPDRCYAAVYQEAVSYVKSTGQFDIATMGNVVHGGAVWCGVVWRIFFGCGFSCVQCAHAYFVCICGFVWWFSLALFA